MRNSPIYNDIRQHVIGTLGCIASLVIGGGVLVHDCKIQHKEKEAAMQVIKEHDINKYIELLETNTQDIETWQKEAQVVLDSIDKTRSTIQTNYAKGCLNIK